MDKKSISNIALVNENTGEYYKLNELIKQPKRKIKRGFRMNYELEDIIQEIIIKSNLDYKIINRIKKKFSYKQTEVNIKRDEIAKELNTSIVKVTSIIKQMVKFGYLLRVKRGIYRLNPFMFIPYNANAEELQKEWIELVKGRDDWIFDKINQIYIPKALIEYQS